MIKNNIFKKIVAKRRKGIVVLLSLLLWGLSPIALGAEQVTYYHLDALGSPIAATDQAGNVVWKEAYRPYGDRIRQEDNGTNTVWYTGKPYESGMGLSYFGARWYDPTIGRFMAIDPAEVNPNNLHSFNRYAYANNNPYKYVDPDGNSPIDVVFLIGDGIKLAAAINSGVGIQGAAADFAASVVGVVSPIPGTGQLIKAGKVASKLSKVPKSARKASNKAPDFVVSPGGTAFPVPKGATGPSSVVNPGGKTTGSAFTGGKGGSNGQVDTIRIMNPTPARGKSPGYPNGYIKYENKAGQGVDPYTGRTLPNKNSHFPID